MGTWFRSRLEASWAAFLEHHAVRWEYEQAWFHFGDGTKYLPDFWLPESRAWLEVKGHLDDASLEKLVRLAGRAQFKGEIVIIAGAPAGQVFGEVMPDGRRLAIDLLRCRNCDAWTFAAMACRACGSWDGDNTFDDAHRHLGGACMSRVPVHADERGACLGAFGYTAQGLREMQVSELDAAAYEHAARLGIVRR
jgi:hypothetical protein